MKTGVFKFLKKTVANRLQRTILLVCLALLLVAITVISAYKLMNHESQTTRLGFKDIGELVTQAAYCTEVNLTDSSVQLWGHNVPFTQSKYIYSYNVVIKAGCDFSRIEWTVNKAEGKISVTLPEMQILSCEIDPDSFKVYHEAESVFNQIRLADNNDAMKNLRDNAINTATENGLFENARANAELLITAFLRADYPADKYSIEFVE